MCVITKKKKIKLREKIVWFHHRWKVIFDSERWINWIMSGCRWCSCGFIHLTHLHRGPLSISITTRSAGILNLLRINQGWWWQIKVKWIKRVLLYIRGLTDTYRHVSKYLIKMADIDFIFYYWYIGWCQLTVCSKGPIDRLKVRMGLNLLDSIPT